MRKIFKFLPLTIIAAFAMPASFSQKKEMVKVVKDAKEKKVDIIIGGKPFTSFLFPDTLEKPVLYPIYAANGTIVTRGFPLKNVPGDPTDHPHHIGSSGRGGGRQAKFRGEDYQAELHLTLNDAYTTHQQTLTVNGKKIRITIPAGVENGQVIKLKGHGGEGINGGPNGDLYITFVIEEHPVFKRLGNDLYTTVEIDLYTAILGGEVMLDTLSGKVKLKVSPETQNGTKIRLKGKGFPVYKNEGQFGDLYITYSVKIPTNLTEKQKALFRELSKS